MKTIGNRTEAAGAEILAKKLCSNSTITKLGLSGNLKWMRYYILYAYLTMVWLGNKIGDEGAIAIGNALKTNSSLATLLLRSELSSEKLTC